MTWRPAPGLRGVWDRVAGPGATLTENAFTLGGATLLTGALLSLASGRGVAWSPLQWALAGALFLDMTGGLICNATPSARRWWHRPGRGPPQHLGFVGLHAAHLAALALVFPAFPWPLAAGLSAYLLIAAALVLAAPPSLQVAAGLAAFGGGVALGLGAGPAPPGLEAIAPLLCAKLLVAYLPARPGD